VAGRSRLRARLIQPAEMAERFPGCLAYLEACRPELDKRNVMGGPAAERHFYQFGRAQSLTKFNNAKIILPALSLEPRYAYDDTNIAVTGGGNGPYYLIRQLDGGDVSNHYLLAVLNHPLSEAMVRTRTSVFGGGYYSHGKQFIADLPIPIPNDGQRAQIEGLVAEMIEALGAVAAARTPHETTIRERQADNLRYQIEARITDIFGLSAADMDVVRAVPVPD
jgi:hypothetical protein